MKNNYFLIIISFLLISSISSSQVLYGPQFEPPGGVFTEYSGTPNDNLIGTAAGKDLTFSAIDFLDDTKVFFGTVEDSIKLSLDGADFASGPDTTAMEVLHYSPHLSDLPNGVLVWQGTTEIPDQPGVPVYSKFIMTFTAYSTPMELIPADSFGIDPYVGGVPDLAPGAMFNVNLKFQATFDTVAGYMPHIPFYDDNSLTDGLAYSSFGWGWYWLNSPPTVETKNTITVDEGDTVIINQNFLEVTDVESDSTMITLTIMDAGLPANGTLYDNGNMITEGSTFTSADLQNDSITMVHNGSETTIDSIAVSLHDGDGAFYTMDGDTTFYLKVMITPVDDSPVQEINMVMELDEEAEETISDTHLLTSDAESADENITYTVDPGGAEEWPKNGLLRKSGVPVGSGGTFTQADINSGLISYKHDGTETLTDGFVFKVTDEYGHPAEKEDGSSTYFFEIDINLLNDNPAFSMNVATAFTEWDDNVVIDSDHLAANDEESPNSEIIFDLVAGSMNPQFGDIVVDGDVVSPDGSFTMQDILDGVVKYVQTSNATEPGDQIVFRITDGDGGMAIDGEFTDFKHIFNITQTSIQDDPFAGLNVFPNPTDGKISIGSHENVESLVILNITGKIVSEYVLDSDRSEIDLSGNPEGYYLLKFRMKDGNVTNRRVLLK